MNPTRKFHIALATAALVAGSACGSTTSNDSAAVDGATADPALAVETTTPPTTAPEPSATTPPTTATTAPTTTLPVDTTPPSEPAPEPEPEPEPDPAPCGDFGPLPPRPDSMPTVLRDTDGDGADDDEVTAYGAADAWRIRIVENGVTSELPFPAIAGFASLDGIEGGTPDQPRVRDFDTGVVYVVETVDGCVQLVETIDPTPSGGIDDLTLVPVSPDPVPVGPTEIVAPDHDTGCGDFGPIPESAPIGYDGMLDLLNDGSADDRLVSYLDGSWKLRSEIDGIVSEVVVDDVGPGSVKVLGLADVGSIRGGDEIIATIGAEASNTKIGVFGHLEGGCLMQYRWADSTPAVFYVGGSIALGYSTWCGVGYIGINGYEQDGDGTYFGFGSAYEEKAIGELSYMLNSDDYTEGMAYEELAPVTFDCFGLSL